MIVRGWRSSCLVVCGLSLCLLSYVFDLDYGASNPARTP